MIDNTYRRMKASFERTVKRRSEENQKLTAKIIAYVESKYTMRYIVTVKKSPESRVIPQPDPSHYTLREDYRRDLITDQERIVQRDLAPIREYLDMRNEPYIVGKISHTVIVSLTRYQLHDMCEDVPSIESVLVDQPMNLIEPVKE